MITTESRALTERKVVVTIVRAISYLVYFWLIVVEIILLMGFVLLLFGANPTAGFTQWVYRNLDRVMAPFRGIFTPIQVGTTSNDVPAIFETSVLFAMIVYGIVALAISALIGWLSGRLAQIQRAEDEVAAEARAEQRRLEAEQRQMSVQQAAYEGARAGQAAAATPAATSPAATSPAPVAPTPPAPPTSAPPIPPTQP
jgi:uncharacterized protein YggT (Ycf19 family)